MASQKIEDKYKKYELREHIYNIPDTYIGSVNSINLELYLYNDESKKMELKEISYAGTFPRLRESTVAGPIEGTLQYKLGSLNFFNEDSSIAKIRVYIRDRAGNTSNVIETPPFPVIYK